MTTSDFGADIFDPGKPPRAEGGGTGGDSAAEDSPRQPARKAATKKAPRKKAAAKKTTRKKAVRKAAPEEPELAAAGIDSPPTEPQPADARGRDTASADTTRGDRSRRGADPAGAEPSSAPLERDAGRAADEDSPVRSRRRDRRDPEAEAEVRSADDLEPDPARDADREDRGDPGGESRGSRTRRRRRRGGRKPVERDHEDASPTQTAGDWDIDEDGISRDEASDESNAPERDRSSRHDEDREVARRGGDRGDERGVTRDDERGGGRRSRQRGRGRRTASDARERRPGQPAPAPDTEVHGQRIAVLLDLARLRREAGNRGAELAFGRLLRHLSRRRHLIRAVAYVTPEDSSAVASTLQGSGIEVRTIEREVLSIAIAVDAMAIAPRVDSVVILPGDPLLKPLTHSLDGAGVRIETGSFTDETTSPLGADRLHHSLGDECLIRP